MRDEELNQQHLLIRAFTSKKIYFLWLTTLLKKHMYYKSWNFKKKKKAAASKLLWTDNYGTYPNLKCSKSQNFRQNSTKKKKKDIWLKETGKQVIHYFKHTESQELRVVLEEPGNKLCQ